MLLIDGSLILLNSKEDNIDVIWLSSSKSEFVNFCNKVGMSLNIAPCHFFSVFDFIFSSYSSWSRFFFFLYFLYLFKFFFPIKK